MTPDRRTLMQGLSATALLTPTLVPARARATEALAMTVCPVVELRQYTLHPGQREVLIDLFSREFVESQEAVGATILGQFRDLDDPDRYVWLRGFADMEARKTALEAFYYGPLWQAHRDAANATIVDNDNVLLLKPLTPGAGFPLGERAPVGAAEPGRGLVVGGVLALSGRDDPLPGRFETEFAPLLTAVGLRPVITLVTEPAENTFPRLPVRPETVLVWFAIRDGLTAADAALARARAEPRLSPLFGHPLQILRLEPTARSRLHG